MGHTQTMGNDVDGGDPLCWRRRRNVQVMAFERSGAPPRGESGVTINISPGEYERNRHIAHVERPGLLITSRKITGRSSGGRSGGGGTDVR